MGDAQRLEVVATALWHAGVGYSVGAVVNALVPVFNATEESDTQVAITAFAQFAGGYLVLSEVMRAILPSSDSYQSPIADGTSLVFFFAAQPELFKRIGALKIAVEAQARNLIFGTTSSGVSGGGPVAAGNEAPNANT